MKKFLSQTGISIAESVIAVALLGGGLLGFYKVNEMMDLTSESSSIVQEMGQFTNYFYATLNSSKACKNSFEGLRKGEIDQEVMDSFSLRNELGDQIVTVEPRIVDTNSFPSLYIMEKSIKQVAENKVQVSYFANNPDGPNHKISHIVEVAYDIEGNFIHCINNETRINVAICDSVRGTYDYLEDKCNFFNLYSGNYSSQQCEGLGGEIIKDEETGVSYCNKGTNWYRKKEETTKTSRRKVEYKIVRIDRFERECLMPETPTTGPVLDQSQVVCPDLPLSEVNEFESIFQNTMGVTKITRSVSGETLIENIMTRAYTSPVFENTPPAPSYSYDSATGNFIPPSNYSTSSYYSSPPQTRTIANANLAIVEDEYRFEKLFAQTKIRTRVEFVLKLPKHIKDAIQVTGSGGPPSDPSEPMPPENESLPGGMNPCIMDPENSECVDPTSSLKFKLFEFIMPSAYGAHNNGPHTVTTSNTNTMQIHSCIEDKPIRHLNNKTYDPRQLPEGLGAISPEDLLNPNVYFKITYEDVVTEEKIERFQTVYY